MISQWDHPINSGKYTIRTAPINKLTKDIQRCVINRTTGAIITGRQRLGKTHSIDLITSTLQNEFKGISIIKISCRYEKSCNERSFFSYLLLCAGHAIHETKRTEPSILRHRLNEFLKMKVEGSCYGYVLLFLDDAQHLSENHYSWLMDIYNELHMSGIHLGCFLFGQPELLHQKSAFMMAKKRHLIARFMLHEFKFHGIMSLKEMEYCLGGYDATDFPKGSGLTFTAYFFPESYAAGWRAASLAEALWTAFLDVLSSLSLPKNPEIPMQYFTRTVERLFRLYQNRAVHLDNITHFQIIEAINFTGFKNYRDDIQDDV